MYNSTISGVDAFDALAFGTPLQSNLDYFQQQYQQVMQNASHFVGDIGNKFMQSVQNIYQTYVSPAAVERIKSVLRVAGDDNMNNIVKPLEGLEALQQASLTMQRWVMTNPIIRETYHQQRCDGYSDTYLDMDPGTVGIVHYDYRICTEGYVYVEEGNEEQEPEFKYSIYYSSDELREGDSELSLSEKVDIHDAWSLTNAYLERGVEDPTSPLAGEL